MSSKVTPLMKQYFEIREKYPDTMLFFQVGDFYELFFDDAKKASSFLAIALTKRGKHKGEHIPLCGVPVHAVNHHLLKLVKGGFKVALCEQMSKPVPGKVVERAVTQVYTPGTLTDETMLDDKSASYLLSFYPGKKRWGLVFTELLTAQIFATSIPKDSYRMVEAELIRFFPDEIIIPGAKSYKKYDSYFRKQGYSVGVAPGEGGCATTSVCNAWVEKQFNDSVLKTLSKNQAIHKSLSLLYSYLKKNQERALDQLKTIKFYEPEDYLILDSSTQKNLEIVKNLNDGSRKNTLFSVVDRAVTPMGSRTIRKWLLRPLVQKQSILQRQEVVEAISKNIDAMQQLESLMSQISDLERIVGRIALGRAHVNDYLSLKNSLKLIPKIRVVLQQYLLFYLTDVVQAKLRDFATLIELLDCAINDDFSKKSIIKKGFDLELDRLRELVEGSQQAVLKLEQREIERTGISSLKIRYNNIAGYYIEVTKPNVKFVPDDYIQKNTLVNRNRYVTEELKQLERDIFKAQNEIDVVENFAFDRVKKDVEEKLPFLRQLAQAIAYLDGLLGFARVAYENGYISPKFKDLSATDILIKKGRHPVVELVSNSGSFIPNDTNLNDEESVWILTGPNMGGKSTYLRQVALLCVMAQSGGMIPAESAELPILDRVFTRIGSGDNLAEGKSTFLVEMEETAVICKQATKNSLVILDEVGRGTSTFDGMALAQAIIEYIAQFVGAKCLFATHYHELTRLSEAYSCISNYHMSCKRSGDGLLFLHKVLKGVAQGSFGIEVAKLANLPKGVIERADAILHGFNGKSEGIKIAKSVEILEKTPEEPSVDVKKLRSIEEELDAVSLDDLSPRQAFEMVWRLKKLV